MARIDAFLKLGPAQGCSDVHLAVGVPPMLRMNGDLLPIKFRDLGDAELESYVTEILSESQQEHVPPGARHRLLVRRGERRALPRQPVPQGHRRRRHVPHDPERRPDARVAEPAADRQEVLRLPPGHGAGHRIDRHRQVDDARRDDRPAQPDAPGQHHQPRGSDRVRPSQQDGTGDPARARHAPALLRRGRARGDARGSRRDPGRRAARRRHHPLGHDRRRNRPPGARHAAHDQRRQDHRPHDRRAAGRGTRADQELPLAEPDRRRDPGAGAHARPARPPGRLRGHGDEPRDRQADHDRPDAHDAVAAADRQGSRDADAGPGAARGDPGTRGRSRRRLRVRDRQATVDPLRPGRHGDPQADVTQGLGG